MGSTELYLTAALVSGNPQKRNRLMQVMARARQRSMQKWKTLVLFLINLYFWWRGGSVTIKDAATGQTYPIDDASLSDSVRLRAMATQATVNSEYVRTYSLLMTIVNYVFDALGDSSEFDLFQGDLFQSMDFQDAPSSAQMQQMMAAWQAKYAATPGAAAAPGLPVASFSGAGVPGSEGNPLKVPGKPGGSY